MDYLIGFGLFLVCTGVFLAGCGVLWWCSIRAKESKK